MDLIERVTPPHGLGLVQPSPRTANVINHRLKALHNSPDSLASTFDDT